MRVLSDSNESLILEHFTGDAIFESLISFTSRYA